MKNSFRHLLTGCLLLLLVSASPVFALSTGLPNFVPLVEQNSPAVVNISTTQKVKPPAGGSLALPPGSPDQEMMQEFLRKFFEQQGRDMPPFEEEFGDASSLGSGFIISPDGFIVTNSHVIAEADEIVVRLSDRRTFVAEIIGKDARSDVALIKIDADALPVLKMGSADKLRAGEWVLAIGSPFGFEHSVTAGIVSAKGRSLPSENYVPFIQTDVAINPGNSGGPLFNMAGEVVGINSQIYSRTGGFMGLSFSIPIEMAMDVVDQLKTNGKVSRGWLGVYIQEVTRELAESFNMDKPSGALVAKVIEGSPSEKAGIQVGDIILEFEGEGIDNSAALPPKVGRVRPGKEADAKVLRDGKEMIIKVVIEELPDNNMAAVEPDKAVDDINRALGLTVEDVAASEEAEGSEALKGVVVSEVTDGAGKKAGVMVGDRIVSLNNAAVDTVSELETIVASMPRNRPVPMLIHRGGSPVFLAIKVDGVDE